MNRAVGARPADRTTDDATRGVPYGVPCGDCRGALAGVDDGNAGVIVPAVDSAVWIRRASVEDVATLARHRAEMFRDMGKLSDAAYEPLVQASTQYFARAIPAGEYVAWIASEVAAPDTPIAGAGVQLRTLLPRPDEDGLRLVPGPEGLILNVFTERAWRRRGIAAALMHRVLDWARERGLGRLVLHASPEGRALYEQLGFVPTNEMRYSGPPHP